ncbi:hypothetical protein BLNAU_2122 [Blattamonas nauphoetae]|uniref:Right handed beta helix domain-containing protein n=1 Tax=Blattamonas nauphoetae TaxID=2049346 RepID=A0ABQ9YH57_9EUKA|nr:hypothetical protein BLNAU_2122 [Blattamonas nauphoetae]
MLTISSSRIEVSPWTSAIVISGSPLEESGRESSVVISKSLLWNEVGSMRGVVETSSFPSFGGSVWVSIVGCSFDSFGILGTDGIGLSLSRTPRQNVESVGRMSSSLIGCSFVNVSSIGCSHSPRLRHLDQKMLGCVVSLTSSHLSGSTIRDVNTGGSVLCSNSSFSSLLPSTNTGPSSNEDPSIILDRYHPLEFKDGTLYYFSGKTPQTSSIDFSHCRFTGAKYPPSARPLTFIGYPGTITILSCSFEYIAHTDHLYEGGAVSVNYSPQLGRYCFFATKSNFTSCLASHWGGAMIIKDVTAVINICRIENCSTADWYSFGGGVFVSGFNASTIVRLRVIDCVIADCTTSTRGGGVYAGGYCNLDVVNTKLERCEWTPESRLQFGGGLYVEPNGALQIERCSFIECSSRYAGGAVFSNHLDGFYLSDSIVKDCHSGTTGAVSVRSHFNHSDNVTIRHVFFDGNSVGDDTTFFTHLMSFKENTTKFPDVAIFGTALFTEEFPTFSFFDCYTTITPDSSGMIGDVHQKGSGKYVQKRLLEDKFIGVGPYLVKKPTAQVNEKTGKIELEMMGNTPLPSQEYEVTMKEDETGAETRFRMLFSDWTGTPVSESEVNLEYNTTYTVTSIVGVPSDSSYPMSTAFKVPFAAWAFNLALNPDDFTFTTPEEPTITPPETPVNPSGPSPLSKLQPRHAALLALIISLPLTLDIVGVVVAGLIYGCASR